MTRALHWVVLCSFLLAGSSLASGARPIEPAEQRAALLAVAVAGACMVGHLVPRQAAVVYGFTASLGIGTLVVLTPDGLSGGALAGPLGYGNANGALCAQGTVAALVPAIACRGRVLRTASFALAAALVLLAWQTGSRAGTATAASCLSAALLCCVPWASEHTYRHVARALVVGTAAASAAVFALTVALGSTHNPGAAAPTAVDRAVEQTLSDRRVALWSEALDLLSSDPISGVGVGRFAEVSPTARADNDARWAHSAFLQHGAESGLPGLLALLGLCSAIYLALWRAAALDPLALVGACAAGAAMTHAAVDYVLHFPVIPVLAALTVGVCVQRGRR